MDVNFPVYKVIQGYILKNAYVIVFFFLTNPSDGPFNYS